MHPCHTWNLNFIRKPFVAWLHTSVSSLVTTKKTRVTLLVHSGENSIFNYYFSIEIKDYEWCENQVIKTLWLVSSTYAFLISLSSTSSILKTVQVNFVVKTVLYWYCLYYKIYLNSLYNDFFSEEIMLTYSFWNHFTNISFFFW